MIFTCHLGSHGCLDSKHLAGACRCVQARASEDVTLLAIAKADYEELAVAFPEQHELIVANLLAALGLTAYGLGAGSEPIDSSSDSAKERARCVEAERTAQAAGIASESRGRGGACGNVEVISAHSFDIAPSFKSVKESACMPAACVTHCLTGGGLAVVVRVLGNANAQLCTQVLLSAWACSLAPHAPPAEVGRLCGEQHAAHGAGSAAEARRGGAQRARVGGCDGRRRGGGRPARPRWARVVTREATSGLVALRAESAHARAWRAAVTRIMCATNTCGTSARACAACGEPPQLCTSCVQAH